MSEYKGEIEEALRVVHELRSKGATEAEALIGAVHVRARFDGPPAESIPEAVERVVDPPETSEETDEERERREAEERERNAYWSAD